MEIKRGKYILRSEPMCCWIDEEYETVNKKTGKPTVVTKNVSGYYPNFRMLAEEGLPRHLLVSSEATSMRKLVEEVKVLEQKIAKMTLKKVSEITDDLNKPIP